MNKKRNSLLIVIITLSSLAVSGCNSVSVRHDHGHYHGHAYGPPPHAPAHGYRHLYHGHNLVFDTYLGVYLVLGLANHYYHSGHFYRYDNRRHFWYHRKGLNKHWSRYHHIKSLPAGLAKKHIRHGYEPDKHKKHVKKNNAVPAYVKHKTDRNPMKSYDDHDRRNQYRENDNRVNDNKNRNNTKNNPVQRNKNKQQQVDSEKKRKFRGKSGQAYTNKKDNENEGIRKSKRQDQKRDRNDRNLKNKQINKKRGGFHQKG